MDLSEIPAYFIREVKEWHALAGNERNAYQLSRLLGIRIRPGARNSVIPGPPATVILEPHLLGNLDSDFVRHEVAHVLMWWSGVEDMLIAEHGSFELARPQIEGLCHAAVGFLRAPQDLVNTALKRYGFTARAVRFVQVQTGMTPQAALKRVIYDDPHACRAGFITSGKYISDVATCNAGLPFWVFDRVPDPTLLFPPEANASFSRLPGGSRLIGVHGA